MPTKERVRVWDTINWTAICSWGLILIGLYYFWTWAFESCTKGVAS